MALIVNLNGSNFVSEKTQAAFEQALQDGHQANSVVNEPAVSPPPAAPLTPPREQARPQNNPKPSPLAPPNYQRVLQDVERGLSQSFEHQNGVLRTHEQYLKNQTEYSQIFFQLAQQQHTIFSNGNTTPQQAKLTQTVLDALANSMMRFHNHQAETLGVHGQYLNQQAEYSQISMRLLQQQYTILVSDNGSHRSVQVLPAALETPPAPPAAVARQPIESVAPTVPPSAEQATVSLPVEFAQTAPHQSGGIAPHQSGGVDAETLSRSLLEIVSEKTGYPAEMLELDMDMEADLGIDSIKRVEILGAIQSLHPDLPQVKPEELAELRTLGQIIDRVNGQSPVDLSKNGKPAPTHHIQRSLVKLKSLPMPDLLEFDLPANHVCLITDDGGPTSAELAQALSAKGWPVVLLGFPPSVIAEKAPVTEGAGYIALENMSEEHLVQQLTEISRRYGPIGAFVHLDPPHKNENGPEKIKHVFFMAKHLKPSLAQAASIGRSCFLTVARLDGAFGLNGATEFDAVGGGLFGLTKTLNLEWKNVFCRALDLHPDLTAEQAAQHIIAELHDPNQLTVEVAYDLQGRTTLINE